MQQQPLHLIGARRESHYGGYEPSCVGEELSVSWVSMLSLSKLDVTDEYAAEVFFEEVEAEYGQLNGLVNCAGCSAFSQSVGS